MKKNLSLIVILISIWTLIGIGIITMIAFIEKIEISQAITTKIVFIYLFLSAILSGIIYKLHDKNT